MDWEILQVFQPIRWTSRRWALLAWFGKSFSLHCAKFRDACAILRSTRYIYVESRRIAIASCSLLGMKPLNLDALWWKAETHKQPQPRGL